MKHSLGLTGLVKTFILILFISISLMCTQTNQKASEMNRLIPEKMPGWMAGEDTETYNRETIFDYINGAGEVYRQYDYRNLHVRQFFRTDYPVITIELFDMGSDKDAYGIFSHSRQGDDIGIGQGSEYRGGLLSFWKSRYFVCISADKQTDKTDTAIFEFARKIEQNIKEDGKPPEILKYLPEDGLRNSSIRYFHKHTSLNLHYYLASENILDLNEQTEAVLARYEPGQTYLLCVRYPDHKLAQAALRDFIAGYIPEADESGLAQIEEHKWVKAITSKDFVVVVFDVFESSQAQALVKSVTAKLSE